MEIKKVPKTKLVEEAKKLRSERLIAISCVDEGNFRVLYHFETKKGIINLEVKVPKEKPIIPTIMTVFPQAELFEREAHDLFDVEFEGNPRLHEPVFLPDDYKGKGPYLKEVYNA